MVIALDILNLVKVIILILFNLNIINYINLGLKLIKFN